MSARLKRQRIRLQVEAGSTKEIRDAFSNATPSGWSSSDVQFELIFTVDAELAALSDIAIFYLRIFASTRAGNPLVEKSVSQDQFNQLLTAEQVEAKTHEHAVIKVSAAEMANLTIATGTTANFWLVITAETTEAPAEEFTVAGTTFTLNLSGTGAPPAAPTPAASYYTRTEADARYLQQNAANANIRFREGKYLQLYDYGTSTWRDVTLFNGQIAVVDP